VQVSELHTLLSPHLLRRVKKDVLQQLPPKLEQLVRVELSPLQRQWYRSLLTKSYPVLLGKSDTTGSGQRPSMLKNLMMELRKCCNHPYLFPGVEPQQAQQQPEEYLKVGVCEGGCWCV
jgi:chromodomain-helicase-DNA-binding protein 4